MRLEMLCNNNGGTCDQLDAHNLHMQFDPDSGFDRGTLHQVRELACVVQQRCMLCLLGGLPGEAIDS